MLVTIPKNILICIITCKREKEVKLLLQSIRYTYNKPINSDLIIIDANKQLTDYSGYIDIVNNVIHNNTNFTQIVVNKNIALQYFLATPSYQYLFILEDDILLTHSGVFERYISTAEKYAIPHMNKNIEVKQQYLLNEDVRVTTNLCGIFQFFTRKCIENVGILNKKLIRNCWEHIEHTYRIHRYYNFNPLFYNFLDVSDSDNYIIDQCAPSHNHSTTEDIHESTALALQELKIPHLPYQDLVRFSQKKLTWDTDK